MVSAPKEVTQQLLLSQNDVAQILAIRPSSVAKMRRQGELPFVKFGKLTRFRADDVRALVAKMPVYTGHIS